MIQTGTSDCFETSRYDRHHIYYSMFSKNPWHCQDRLKNSTVVLIGMGGIGSWITYCLAGAGIGTIIGVDHDGIELTNLTRQILYSEEDIGKTKVECAAERIRRFNSEIQFIPINKKIASIEEIRQIIRGANLVLLSADTPDSIHEWVNTACIQERVAWSVTGYIEMHGICGPLVIPTETGCSQCCTQSSSHLFQHLTEEQLELIQGINQQYQAPSFGPFNCMLSGFQALEAIKYLSGYAVPETKGVRFIIHSGTMDMVREQVARNPNCDVCGVI